MAQVYEPAQAEVQLCAILVDAYDSKQLNMAIQVSFGPWKFS
jgi:hypothetical protein